MQTIGEKLEEARKHRGISIREASEVTKIRGEYLASFESNSFDLNLPEIYVRGFLRGYAQFLKLNPDKIITDYSAHQLGESKSGRRESREVLGRMDIHNPEEGKEADAPASGFPGPAVPPHAEPIGEKRFDYQQIDKSTLLKIGAAIAGAVVLVAVIIFVVVAIFKSGPDTPAGTEAGTNQAAKSANEMTILSEGGDILSVTVTEVSTGREIFRGSLADGQSQTIPYDQQVRLTYTQAEYLFIEQDGVKYSIGGTGMRQSTFPQKPR